MEDDITPFDIAMDLITLLHLGQGGRIFSDRPGCLDRAIAMSLSSMPDHFAAYFQDAIDQGKMASCFHGVITAATELGMITFVDDALVEFTIQMTDAEALRHAAAIEIPIENLASMGILLCQAIDRSLTLA